MLSFKQSFIFVLLLCVSSQAAAVGVFVEGGIHSGGDTIVTAVFTDGSTESIKAGDLISGAIGIESDITDSLLLKLSAGLKIDLILAENADLSFERMPFEAMLFFKGETLHLGAGITHHRNVRLRGDFGLGIPTVDYEDATGYAVQLDYLLNERGYLSLKYTAIDYQVFSGGPDIDGSSIGILIGLRFGK